MQLVLNKYGISLKIENGMFKVKHEDETISIPVGKVKSVLLNKSVQLSSDVLMIAIENQIEVILTERNGKPVGRVWSHKYGSISKIRKNQLEFTKSPIAVAWTKGLLIQKLENQQSVLLSVASTDFLNGDEIEKPIAGIGKQIDKLKNLPIAGMETTAPKFRSIEARAALIYFQTLSKHLPEQYKFQSRSQHPAYDSFNALLNYAYGMLYIKIESALIKAGIDPYLGIMHRDEYNRPVLVYDCIEIFRAWADFVVTDLCMQQVIFPEFFEIENGVFWLNDSAKRILITTFNEYMDEVINWNHFNRSRNAHIDIWSQKLATEFKKFKPETTKPF